MCVFVLVSRASPPYAKSEKGSGQMRIGPSLVTRSLPPQRLVLSGYPERTKRCGGSGLLRLVLSGYPERTKRCGGSGLVTRLCRARVPDQRNAHSTCASGVR